VPAALMEAYPTPLATHSRGSVSVGKGSEVRNVMPAPKATLVPARLRTHRVLSVSAAALRVLVGVLGMTGGSRREWRTVLRRRRRLVGFHQLGRYLLTLSEWVGGREEGGREG
jgi:hypothetical protein